MRRRRYVVLAVCILVMVLGSPAARAWGSGTLDDGILAFFGVAVALMCGVSTGHTEVLTVRTRKQQLTQQTVCIGLNALIAAPQMCAVTMTYATNSQRHPPLRYFDDRTKASHPSAANPVLIPQNCKRSALESAGESL